MSSETVRETSREWGGEVDPSTPGLVLIFSGAFPYFLPFPVTPQGLSIGRDELRDAHISDDRVSRRHLRVEPAGKALKISDLGSTNGLFVGAQQLPPRGSLVVTPPAVLRAGRTIFLLVEDVAPYLGVLDRGVVHEEVVSGPRLHVCHQQIAVLARGSTGLFVQGESGSGKEIAAQVFHQSGPRAGGPLVAINCATIPRDLAERLLFGAVKGAYSGATSDAQGYLQAAHGGTLFLDEVAELDLSVQAKLLRALETRQVTPLGGTRSFPFDAGLCVATLKSLRGAVSTGAFREDLYYRIGRPEVLLPPLRERPEEIPFFVEQVMRATGSKASASLVEACLLRPWPGNVRELRAEIHTAAALAAVQQSEFVELEHLSSQAGQLTIRPASPQPASSKPASVAPETILRLISETLGLANKTILKLLTPEALAGLAGRLTKEQAAPFDRERWLRALVAEALLGLLQSHEFEQKSAASTLGVSRTTLVKLMEDLELPRAVDLDAEEVLRVHREVSGDVEQAARLLRVSPGALRRRLNQLLPKTP